MAESGLELLPERKKEKVSFKKSLKNTYATYNLHKNKIKNR